MVRRWGAGPRLSRNFPRRKECELHAFLIKSGFEMCMFGGGRDERASDLGFNQPRPAASFLAVPAPPANLSLGWTFQPPALRTSWSPPPGGWDGFRLRLHRLRPLALESDARLEAEAQNFSWAKLPAGTEFLVQLSSLRGPDESTRANTTGWTRE